MKKDRKLRQNNRKSGYSKNREELLLTNHKGPRDTEMTDVLNPSIASLNF